MLDPQVAYDKLAGFENCKEIASFFESQGVVGIREGLYSCPIARWMREITGQSFEVSDAIKGAWSLYFPLTEGMQEFITLFDAGEFIALDADYEPSDAPD